MAVRKATTVWENDLLNGSGKVNVASSALPEFPVSWKARTEGLGPVTSPEELLAAAHASCFAMALSATLARKGLPPQRLTVSSEVSFDKIGDGWKVTKSALNVTGKVPGLDGSKFEEIAKEAEKGCPISNALRNNVDITVNAKVE
jgi:lipoyl-dependent peroxiredoxin